MNRRRPRVTPAVAATALLLVLAACGSGGSSSATSASAPSTPSTASATTSASTTQASTASAGTAPSGSTAAPATGTAAPSTAGAGGAAEPTPAPAPEPCAAPAGGPIQWPVRTGGGRQLLDASGRPILLTGDSAWSLVIQLRDDEVDRYLADRRARGFNALLVNLIDHKFGTKAPSTVDGVAPFARAGDFAAPDEDYFAHADSVLRRARDAGFVVLLAPAYVGYRDSDEGFWPEMVAAGPDVMRSFGEFVGRRYGGLGNVVWVQGGDDTPPDQSIVDAVADGVRAGDPDGVQTAHTARYHVASADWPGRDWLTLDNVYAADEINEWAAKAYAVDAARPFILLEGWYENEHDVDPPLLRRQAYGALLGGATGQVYGNNPMWHFGGWRGAEGSKDWEAALDSEGARSMQHVAELFAGLPWPSLVPVFDGAPVTEGRGKGTDRVLVASGCDGALLVLYVPTSRDLTVEAPGLSPARWFDPASGETSPADVEVDGGSMRIGSPGRNATGDRDWVLLIGR